MTDLPAVLTAAAAAVVTAPYLAGLTLATPDRDRRRWAVPQRVSAARTVTVGAVSLALAVLAAAVTGWSTTWAAWQVLALLSAVLVVVDVEHHRLPDRITGNAAAAGAVLFTAAAALGPTWSPLGRAALAAAAVGAAFYLLALLSPHAVGLGDVKLAALLAGYLGWSSWALVLQGLAVGFLLAGIVSAALLVTGRATRTTLIPMGPFLITGAIVVAAALH